MVTTRYRLFKFDVMASNTPFVETWYVKNRKRSSMLLDDLFFLSATTYYGSKSIFENIFNFRRSCREGICGSCSMNINGKNGLACIYKVKETARRVSILPLAHMPLIRDVIVDMKHFYYQYKSINPFLIIKNTYYSAQFFSLIGVNSVKNKLIKHNKENIQSIKDRLLLDGLYECILCACCSTSCPSYWWNRDKYLGPAVLLQSYRWIVDSRDQYIEQRLNTVNDNYKINRCHAILNCVRCCPKNLNPAEAISNTKAMISFFSC